MTDIVWCISGNGWQPKSTWQFSTCGTDFTPSMACASLEQWNLWCSGVFFTSYGWYCLHTHTHPRLTALFPGLPRRAGTRKVKPIWILLKQETVSGSGISWAICKSAPSSRQITTPAPHHSVFYRPDALPATQPTVSKHWRCSVK